MIPKIETVQALTALFPTTKEDIEYRVSNAIEQATHDLNSIYTIPSENRTFDNTAGALDRAMAQFNMPLVLLKTLELVSPDESIRESAHKGALTLYDFNVDNFLQNQRLYEILKHYEEHKSHNEELTRQERYYLQETLSYYTRSGLNLPNNVQDRIKIIRKQLGKHEINFEAHIATDNRTLEVTKEELSGLSESFISSLKQTDKNTYVLGTDYPTYFYVMEYCSHESTRKNLWKAFVNRGYPANKLELEKVIALRDELAELLGFDSYAHLNIAGEMACSPEIVEGFLFNLLDRCEPKVQDEIALLKKTLPPEIQLTPYDTFKPWDVMYVKSSYKKRYLSIDEERIAEYFPFEHTLKQLMLIYHEFFGLTFKKVEASLWHETVETFEVFNELDEKIGFLILDLFPREHKFSHAAQETIVPAVKTTSTLYPAVALVMANFPSASSDRPALLQRTDVITLFHEFGHAIHALVGATPLATLSGTAVKRDFVEMPSQMLEEWMWDASILKRVSKHYKTGQSLPDDTIDMIIKFKHFDAGDWIQRQCYLSLLSLEYYRKGAHKDVDHIQQELYRSIRTPVEFSPEDHFYASFGHLMEYGAQYYSYLWSKVFALDLFDYIKGQGLLNRAIGSRYIFQVIGKGGSDDPAYLLRDFLGRPPSADAFLKDLGL